MEDNLRPEDATDTTEDTKIGSVKIDGKHAAALNCRDVTKHRTDNVEDGDTTASVGKGYEDH